MELIAARVKDASDFVPAFAADRTFRSPFLKKYHALVNWLTGSRTMLINFADGTKRSIVR